MMDDGMDGWMDGKSKRRARGGIHLRLDEGAREEEESLNLEMERRVVRCTRDDDAEWNRKKNIVWHV